MSKLFISYRVDDSVHAAMALADQLAEHYGAENVFRDRGSVPLGAPYPPRIRRALEECDTVLAVIGPRWLDVYDPKTAHRLGNSHDWVETELRVAFDRGIPVVPVLLDETPLPIQDELPADIRLLGLSTYWKVRNRSFAADVRELIENLGPVAGETVPRPHASSNVQHNSATKNSKLFANQGGDQIIHWNGGGTER